MATEILRPNAAGDETNIHQQYPNSTYHWDKVDEETADETTFVYDSTQDDVYYRDLYNLPAHSVGSGTINSITVYARAKGASSINQASLKIALKTNGTPYESSEIQVTGSYDNYSEQWDTNPATELAWTWDEIDALQIGVAIRRCYTGIGYSTRVTQVYVEVDYTAPTAKTSSDSGSGVDAILANNPLATLSRTEAGSGIESTPMSSAILTGSETGSGIETLVAQLLAAVDIGTGIEMGSLFNDLTTTELGWGSDSLTAKIEIPTKGGGMKLWT